MEIAVDNHHLLYTKAWYKSPLEKAIRNHEGLVFPMFRPVHKDLHAECLPPPKPTREIILGTLAMLDDLKPQILHQPTEVTLAMAEFMLGREENIAHRIGHNLLQQHIYIQDGQY